MVTSKSFFILSVGFDSRISSFQDLIWRAWEIHSPRDSLFLCFLHVSCSLGGKLIQRGFYVDEYNLIVVFLQLTGHWLLMDALGMGLCVAFIALVRLPSLKVSTLLLSGLLLYDVFWVRSYLSLPEF